MALQFVLGGSGSGKSAYVFDRIAAESIERERERFFILAPDQFTMQTQMELVRRHPRGGMMNIDVLSFNRLAYRVMEEVGESPVPILDDTGKSLVLRKVAEELRQEVPLLGGFLKKPGYISQIKSVISEFMQYGIDSGQLAKMLKDTEKRGSLCGKLRELKLLYEAFLAYLKNRYLTTEETLERLARQIGESHRLRGSVIVLDGFTGFTPIQLKVIGKLLIQAKEVIVTLALEKGEGRKQLFSLSEKTRASLEKLARNVGRELLPPLWISGKRGRFQENPALEHLEKRLFSYPARAYNENTDSIRLEECPDMEEEVRQLCRHIRQLLREGYGYRDIAVISGELEAYASLIEEQFGRYGFPYFLDKTRGLTLNPFIEYIRSALRVITANYSYEAVFHYLRSGMAGVSPEETDRLENYCLAYGIKGKKAWHSLFVHRAPKADLLREEDGVRALEELNRLREKIAGDFHLLLPGKQKVKDLARQLYDFLLANRCQERLAEYERYFAGKGELSREKEYAQIYRLVMGLLDQLVSLLAEEEMSWEEFAQTLDAGFGEIQVGVIPQAVDRILVGDMERTRLSPIKALFFLGVNEGKIPRQTDKGGLLSDLDREFLEAAGHELAPTPRSRMLIQRFYLYLNVTKPSRRLYLSYARLNAEGKSMKPSYFIEVIKRLYPGLPVYVGTAADGGGEKALGLPPQTAEEAKERAACLLARCSAIGLEENKKYALYYLLSLLAEQKEGERWVGRLLDKAFFTYEGDRISREAARLLYGDPMYSSVSRLERMATCAYAHFLQYGLGLKPRQEFGFEAADRGNVFHGALELFAAKLAEQEQDWRSFSEEEGRRLLHEALESCAAGYGDTALFADARGAYGLETMERILLRTVKALQYQLRAGSFHPESAELPFSAMEDLEAVTIPLGEEGKLKLGGRIDRIDTYETGDKLYVKVMDYKSGSHKFDLAAFYHGLQLQLVIYLSAAMELEQKKHPQKEILPGALLYYRIADPMIEVQEEWEEEELQEKIHRELRVTGIVNKDAEALQGLDNSGNKKSLVIPVDYKADGSLSGNSAVLDREHIGLLMQFSRRKAQELGRRIAAGEVSMNPCRTKAMDACAYCDFRRICEFEEKIPGFQGLRLGEEKPEELWERIREELEGTGHGVYRGAKEGHRGQEL